MNPATGLLFAVLGLIAGSFATAASHRLVRDLPLAAGRSRCPHCGHVLGPADLVPVGSWLWLRGRCRYCSAAISGRYPAIELASMALFVLAWLDKPGDPVLAGLLALTGLGLLIIVIADLEAGIIPDAVQLWLVPVALGWRWVSAGGFDNRDAWLDCGSGAVIAFLALFTLRAGFRRLRGIEGMGFGDVKFAALAGCYVGLSGLPSFLVAAGVLGILFGILWRLAGKGRVFPFGPALCAALLLKLMLPDLIAVP